MSNSKPVEKMSHTTLPNLFEQMNPAALQKLTRTLMEASREAQGLLTDMTLSTMAAPLSPQKPDPFGAFDAQTKVAAALARNPEKAGHAMMTLFQGWMNLFQSIATNQELPTDRRFAVVAH